MQKLPMTLLVLGLVVLLWSGINPADRFTWFLEVVPALIGALILLTTYSRFRLTPLAYVFIFIHAVVLMVGGKYTYAQVPLGFWLQDLFDFQRNHYDRIGHLAQGFFPAIVAREILLRKSPLVPGKWLFFLVVCFCLAFSAFYELIEWWVAISTGEAAESFLGTQGDVWDSQWDMFSALIGSIASLLLFSRLHDRQLKTKIPPGNRP